jgi:hypothetical protein
VERIGQCHCGSLRVIATGEPDRVYLCHCTACQRRTGTLLSIPARVIPKIGCGSTVNGMFTNATPTAVFAFDFISGPNCGSTLYWEGDRNPAVCGVAVGAFDTSAFSPPSDSIWEDSMHRWLGLPASMGHHQQNRPPVTNQTTK